MSSADDLLSLSPEAQARLKADLKAAVARRRQTMIAAYLLLKVSEEDWHGVSDAANDLRVMEARHAQ